MPSPSWGGSNTWGDNSVSWTGLSVALPKLDLLGALNELAGTSGLGFNAVCNLIAGTSGLDGVGALNVANGTSGLELRGVLKQLAPKVSLNFTIS